MKEFEVNGVQYMAVDIEGEYHSYEIGTSWGGQCIFCISYGHIAFMIDIPAGPWEIVGLVQDIFDNNAKKEIIKHNLNDNSLIIKKI